MNTSTEIFYFKDEVVVCGDSFTLAAVVSFAIRCNETQLDWYKQLEHVVSYLKYRTGALVTIEELLDPDNLIHLKQLQSQILRETPWFELAEDLPKPLKKF